MIMIIINEIKLTFYRELKEGAKNHVKWRANLQAEAGGRE